MKILSMEMMIEIVQKLELIEKALHNRFDEVFEITKEKQMLEQYK